MRVSEIRVKQIRVNQGLGVLFLIPKTWKKPSSKVAHNRPPTFFFSTGPAAQTAQNQTSRTTKSPLMQVLEIGFLSGSPFNGTLETYK